jgi:hypothetical protein
VPVISTGALTAVQTSEKSLKKDNKTSHKSGEASAKTIQWQWNEVE